MNHQIRSTVQKCCFSQTRNASYLAFIVGCLLISGCAQAKPEQAVKPTVVAPSKLAEPVLPANAGAPETISFEKKYAVEIAMGADCPTENRWSSRRLEEPLNDGACSGRLPIYFDQFMAGFYAKSSTLLQNPVYEQFFKSADNRFYFRAVTGFGKRHDILVGLPKGAWVRSFEGIDPTITMYMVHAPFICNTEEWRAAKRAGPAVVWQECENPALRLRLYRVKNNGSLQDVTAAMLPRQPVLTDVERKHYEQYGADSGGIYMYTDTLQYAPTISWGLELDPDLPLPESDPRGPGTMAHFGFLIWTGRRFEMRNRVPRSYVPCRIYASGTISKCISGTDSEVQKDRFIIEGK